MSSPVLHLMWKEYRSLRPLWLGTLAVAVCLSVPVIFLSGSAPLETIGGVLWITTLAASLFLLVALCIAFAGETEDRTRLLLQQLAPGWRQLMLGKLSVIGLGTGLLAVTLMLTGAILVAVACMLLPDRFMTGWSLQPVIMPDGQLGVPTVATSISLLICLTGVLLVPTGCCAMLSRKVVTAALTGIPAALAAYAGTVLLIESTHPIPMAMVWLCVGLPLFTGLSLAWHRGVVPLHANASLADSSPGVAARWISIGLGGLALLWFLFSIMMRYQMITGPLLIILTILLLGSALLVRTTVRVRTELLSRMQPSGIRDSMRQLSMRQVWLLKISSRPESPWRTRSMLLWKEVSSAGSFPLRWGITGLLLMWIGLVSQSNWLIIPPMPFILLMALFCQECGLRTMRDEHARGTTRFLLEHSVAPSAVWWTKLAVWGLLMLAVMTLWLAVDFLVSSLQWPAQWSSVGILRSRSVSHLLTQIRLQTGDSLWQAICIPVAFSASCFVSGIVAAGWLRRPILAFAFAGLLSMLLLAAICTLILLQIPLWKTVWPVLLTWVILSRLSFRWSLSPHSSWKRDVSRLAVMVVCLVLAFLSAMQARVDAIPDVFLFRPSGYAGSFSASLFIPPPSSGSAPEAALAGPSPAAAPGDQLWPQLYREWKNEWSRPVRISPQDSQAVQTLTRMLTLSRTNSLGPVPKESRSPWAPSMTPPVVYAATLQAGQLMHEERASDALALLMDALDLVQQLDRMNFSWAQLLDHLRSRQTLLRELGTCLASDQLTLEHLEAAGRLRAILQVEQKAAPMLYARFNFFQRLLSERFETSAPSGGNSSNELNDADVFPLASWEAWAGTESHRFVKLLMAATAVQIERLDGISVTPEPIDIPELMRQATTTLDFGTHLVQEVRSFNQDARNTVEYQMLTDTIAAERATLLILELQKYRRRNDQFPENLEVLLNTPEIHEQVAQATPPLSPGGLKHAARIPDDPRMRFVQSPWTGTLFGYAAHGVGREIVVNLELLTWRQEVLAPQQPILWSRSWPSEMDRISRQRIARLPQISATNSDEPTSAADNPAAMERLLEQSRVPLQPHRILLEW